MKLSNRHQEILDSVYPDGYPTPIRDLHSKDLSEADCHHIMFVKILPDGDRSMDVPSFRMYHQREWEQMKRTIEKHGIKVTGYNEYSVVYDPKKAKAESTAKVPTAAAESKANVKSELKQRPGPKPAAPKKS